jgi:RimJ/RimL family protein N-acetyltransferase
VIRTERLLLRRWRAEDRAPFAALNADPAVMEHFPAPLTRQESDALADRIEAGFDRHGFGLWAVQAGGVLVGFTGLSVPPPEVAPEVEVGWRLARSAWGHGYAAEAARAAIAHGRGVGVGAVVSFTAVDNVRSRRVMERLGMTHDPAEDFDHPRVPAGHRLRRHVLYRLGADRQPSSL